MRFTLTYNGPLRSRGSTIEKGQLREALHPQLNELWRHEPLISHVSGDGVSDSGPSYLASGDMGIAGS